MGIASDAKHEIVFHMSLMTEAAATRELSHLFDLLKARFDKLGRTDYHAVVEPALAHAGEQLGLRLEEGIQPVGYI